MAQPKGTKRRWGTLRDIADSTGMSLGHIRTLASELKSRKGIIYGVHVEKRGGRWFALLRDINYEPSAD